MTSTAFDDQFRGEPEGIEINENMSQADLNKLFEELRETADIRELALQLTSAKVHIAKLEAERVALAAHVDALHGAILAPFVSCSSDAESMEEARSIAMNTPATSLAKRDARVSAAAVEKVANQWPPGSATRSWMMEFAGEYMQKAEGGDHE